MSSSSCTRRRFLSVVAHGGALAGAAALGAGCGVGNPTGSYAAGNVSALQVGTLQAISAGPLALGRDAEGVYAMTLICTHAGCDMASDGSVSASGVICDCHGSRFDANGNPLSGPAQSPLEHYEVTIDGTGAITIDADVTVGETTRTAVPA
jgi:cytochrome b6-f complex iron-sulfur subunit